ncbi:MAG: hypothetical protein H0T73_13140 [Ardenticatenales bacterium]|nr:hypothetical protein [Ardenticatenales bacterium]
MDVNLIIMGAIAVLLIVWIFGLIRKIGGCLIHLLLIAAGAILIFAIYTGRLTIPL